MRRTVGDQGAVFRSDAFLSRLHQGSEIRFALHEHAPVNERRTRFQECLQQRILPLSFKDVGVNISLKIHQVTESSTSVTFDSELLILDGVWVTFHGTISTTTLEGRARLDMAREEAPEIEYLTAENLQELRNLGLPC